MITLLNSIAQEINTLPSMLRFEGISGGTTISGFFHTACEG